MKLLANIAGVLMVVIVGLTILTLEAAKRAHERADCYRAAKEVCPSPAWWEKMLRHALSNRSET